MKSQIIPTESNLLTSYSFPPTTTNKLIIINLVSGCDCKEHLKSQKYALLTNASTCNIINLKYSLFSGHVDKIYLYTFINCSQFYKPAHLNFTPRAQNIFINIQKLFSSL